MRDEQAHFYVAVADLCAAANLASLPIELLTAGGDRVVGVPAAIPPPLRPEEEVDETGYARALLIDDTIVDLLDVRRCTISAPDDGAMPPED